MLNSKTAWHWYWLIDCCTGCCQSCPWLHKQLGHRNGIFNTSKSTSSSFYLFRYVGVKLIIQCNVGWQCRGAPWNVAWDMPIESPWYCKILLSRIMIDHCKLTVYFWTSTQVVCTNITSNLFDEILGGVLYDSKQFSLYIKKITMCCVICLVLMCCVINSLISCCFLVLFNKLVCKWINVFNQFS